MRRWQMIYLLLKTAMIPFEITDWAGLEMVKEEGAGVWSLI